MRKHISFSIAANDRGLSFFIIAHRLSTVRWLTALSPSTAGGWSALAKKSTACRDGQAQSCACLRGVSAVNAPFCDGFHIARAMGTLFSMPQLQPVQREPP
jgi:hypothetical protein